MKPSLVPEWGPVHVKCPLSRKFFLDVDPLHSPDGLNNWEWQYNATKAYQVLLQTPRPLLDDSESLGLSMGEEIERTGFAHRTWSRAYTSRSCMTTEYLTQDYISSGMTWVHLCLGVRGWTDKLLIEPGRNQEWLSCPLFPQQETSLSSLAGVQRSPASPLGGPYKDVFVILTCHSFKVIVLSSCKAGPSQCSLIWLPDCCK